MGFNSVSGEGQITLKLWELKQAVNDLPTVNGPYRAAAGFNFQTP